MLSFDVSFARAVVAAPDAARRDAALTRLAAQLGCSADAVCVSSHTVAGEPVVIVVAWRGPNGAKHRVETVAK